MLDDYVIEYEQLGSTLEDTAILVYEPTSLPPASPQNMHSVYEPDNIEAIHYVLSTELIKGNNRILQVNFHRRMLRVLIKVIDHCVKMSFVLGCKDGLAREDVCRIPRTHRKVEKRRSPLTPPNKITQARMQTPFKTFCRAGEMSQQLRSHSALEARSEFTFQHSFQLAQTSITSSPKYESPSSDLQRYLHPCA